MKRKALIFVMLLFFSGTFVFQSCEEESTLVKTYNAFTIPEPIAPANGAFLSPAGTTVELQWSSTNADGDPQNWDVYFGPSEDPAKVITGNTSQSYTVTVAIGTKYYWRVVGWDKNGVPTNSDIWSFEIVDPDSPLNVKMEWSTNVKDVIGLDLKPQVAANLRMIIFKPDSTLLTTVNTTEFEEYSFNSLMADGKYFIIADLASSIDAGDFTETFDIDIKLTFSQRGIIFKSFEFPVVMNTQNPCPLYSTLLTSITKTGSSYALKDALQSVTPPVITWYGTDATYPSEVTTTESCVAKTMSMLGNGWMFDWWGETIVKGGTLNYTIDGSGNITIPFQYYCTTTYGGTVQPDYSIQGTGTVDNTGAYPVWTLHYDFQQAGTWIGHYCFLNYGWEQDGFDAVITTEPDPGKKGGTMSIRPPKPVR
jgi:hypothetical protein